MVFQATICLMVSTGNLLPATKLPGVWGPLGSQLGVLVSFVLLANDYTKQTSESEYSNLNF